MNISDLDLDEIAIDLNTSEYYLKREDLCKQLVSELKSELNDISSDNLPKRENNINYEFYEIDEERNTATNLLSVDNNSTDNFMNFHRYVKNIISKKNKDYNYIEELHKLNKKYINKTLFYFAINAKCFEVVKEFIRIGYKPIIVDLILSTRSSYEIYNIIKQNINTKKDLTNLLSFCCLFSYDKSIISDSQILNTDNIPNITKYLPNKFKDDIFNFFISMYSYNSYIPTVILDDFNEHVYCPIISEEYPAGVVGFEY